ncbi:hypothetical protein [Acidilobus sp.]|uniref:hypothetical protein n=1 Tax=Acidilobus sp. TaxID=1872109 RepID=UPI003D044ED2
MSDGDRRTLILLVAPLGSIAQLRGATYVVDEGCRLKSKCKVPSAVVSYAYLRRKFPGADLRVLGLLPESLMAELDNVPDSYDKAVSELKEAQLNNIKEGLSLLEEVNCGLGGLASDFTKDLRLEVVPMGGTFTMPKSVGDACRGEGASRDVRGQLKVEASLYDSQAVAAYLISRELAALRAVDYDEVRIYVDVTNAPNQLQVMTVRAAEGAVSALSMSTSVFLGFSALDPYVAGGELSLNVVEQRPLPGIRLPSGRPGRLLEPRVQDKDVIDVINKLRNRYITAILNLVGAAASINLGALFLTPYLLREAGMDPLRVAEAHVAKYFELTEVTGQGGSVTLRRRIKIQEGLETISYLSLAAKAMLRLDGEGCVKLKGLKDVAETLEDRGLGIAVNAVQEYSSIVKAAEGRDLSAGMCLQQLKGHSQSKTNDREVARDLVAHAGLVENVVIIRGRGEDLRACLSCSAAASGGDPLDYLRGQVYAASGLQQ